MARVRRDEVVVEVVGERDPAPEARGVRWRWVVVVVGVVVLLAACIALLADEPATPPPPSPGIFSLASVDAADSPTSQDTTYPILGRKWGLTALWVQQAGIVAFDLDTGRNRLWIPNDPEVSTRSWNAVSLVDGVPYLSFGETGIVRMDGATPITVEQDGGRVPIRVVGAYLVPDTFPPGEAVLTHLPTGATVAMEDNRRFAVIGDTVLVERGGAIYAHEPGRDPAFWADGELVARGSNAAIHRRCQADGQCRSFAGRVDDPRALELDDRAVERLLGQYSQFPFVPADVVDHPSPDGRFALASSTDVDGSFRLELLDLVDGSTVAINQRPVGWTPDSSAFATDGSPPVGMVSMDDGSAARLPILPEAGARWRSPVLFVPTNELPVID